MAKKRRKAAKKSAKKSSSSKKSSSKGSSGSGLYLTAIVGMVAVVAVVIMILNAKSGSLVAMDDITGMAVTQGVQGKGGYAYGYSNPTTMDDDYCYDFCRVDETQITVRGAGTNTVLDNNCLKLCKEDALSNNQDRILGSNDEVDSNFNIKR